LIFHVWFVLVLVGQIFLSVFFRKIKINYIKNIKTNYQNVIIYINKFNFTKNFIKVLLK